MNQVAVKLLKKGLGLIFGPGENLFLKMIWLCLYYRCSPFISFEIKPELVGPGLKIQFGWALEVVFVC